MTRRKEIAEPTSCFNKAGKDELMFILLSRDPAAPAAINAWIKERIKLGLNSYLDPKIVEAWDCAAKMIMQRLANEPND